MFGDNDFIDGLVEFGLQMDNLAEDCTAIAKLILEHEEVFLALRLQNASSPAIREILRRVKLARWPLLVESGPLEVRLLPDNSLCIRTRSPISVAQLAAEKAGQEYIFLHASQADEAWATNDIPPGTYWVKLSACHQKAKKNPRQALDVALATLTLLCFRIAGKGDLLQGKQLRCREGILVSWAQTSGVLHFEPMQIDKGITATFGIVESLDPAT